MIEIKVDTDHLEQSLTKLSQRLVHRRPLMQRLAGVMHNAVDENFEAEGRPKWLGIKHRQGRVLRDSGALQNSISERSDDDTAMVGTNLAYAAIHQFGGVIRPRHARYLAIPLNEKARIAGSPRNLDVELVFVETDNGKFLLDPVSETFMYVLVSQVTIPARAYLGISADDRDDMLDAIQRRIEGATPNA